MAKNKLPSVWKGWETVGVLGRGSFGTVYEIRKTRRDGVEHAAVKVITIPQRQSEVEELRVRGYDDQAVLARFEEIKDRIEQEYMTMARLKGAVNVVYCDEILTVPHKGEIGWDIYIKMELLTPLVKALSSPIEEAQVVKLGKDISRALVTCEQENVIHRDIKPQNIFVSRDGTYKLGDFGVAKTIAETGSASVRVGTYDYMAPEVYHGEHYGHKADLYSLGLVLYWMLNECCPPFMPLPPALPTGQSESEARRKRLSGTPLPPPAHGSDELKRIVLKACAYDPKDRYQNAAEMLRDLEAVREETIVPLLIPDPVPPVPPSTYNQEKAKKTRGFFDNPPPPLPDSDPKPKRWLIVLPCALAVLALVFAGLYYLPGWRPATCSAPETHRLLRLTRGEALGHAWGDWTVVTEPSCTEDGLEQRVCLNDPEHVDERPVAATGHQYTDATCTEPSVCAVCGEESSGPIGHDWGEPTYTWSYDGKSVTAKRVCLHDPSHVETETAKTTGQVITAATCTAMGKTTYTATFKTARSGRRQRLSWIFLRWTTTGANRPIPGRPIARA